jgi:hypothetical protein
MSLPPKTTRGASFLISDARFVVALMPEPMPGFLKKKATAREIAEDRRAALQGNKAQLVVFLFPKPGAYDRLDQHLLLARLLFAWRRPLRRHSA